MAASFLETQIGWGLPHAVGYGFPSSRHHEVADRIGPDVDAVFAGIDIIPASATTFAFGPRTVGVA